MLRELFIQNIAVIHKASIEFKRGLNVFTGETGAGKTVLISAIDAVLGERASRDMIRTGEDRAVVSALFENISPRAQKKLEELGFEHDDGTVLIAREITQAGKTNCKIGGMPATASMMKEISSLLISIHGQRDASQLLHSENHLELIDLFGAHADELEQYRASFENMRQIQSQLAALNTDDAQKAQRIDMLSFQIKEIESANLEDENEEETLLARKKLIRNSEKVLNALSLAYEALAGGEESAGVTSLFDDFNEGCGTAAAFIAELEPTARRVSEIAYELTDFSAEIRSYLDGFEFDPRELDNIESRLDAIYKLKRKYGATIAEIISFCGRAAEELETISMSGERAQKLEEELTATKSKAQKLASSLSQKRLKAAKQFTELVEKELAFLDMPAVRLSMERKEKPLAQDGVDDMEFLIVTNMGELPKPLSKIASGGEMARIMLAIKNVLANRDDIDTLIFDEVDSGVSGRAAQKIGRKLKQVASTRQVICVTHLAQVAAFADHHLLIRKEVEKGRTFTKVTPLDETRTIEELARITGGDLITDISLQSARELWEHAQNSSE